MNYAQQTEFVRGLNLKPGEKRRTACPVCGKPNTFSVENKFGTHYWDCFSASCEAKGISDGSRSAETLRILLRGQETPEQEFEAPPYFVPLTRNDEAVNWVVRMHSWDAYAGKRADIRYDPKEHRVVFMVKDQNSRIIDASGRALNRELLPKWRRYGDSRQPFICGNSEIGVIVEDAPSACAVSSVATGIALMGTSLQSDHLDRLRGFSRIIIALDKDASRKSLEISRQLCYYNATTVRFLEDDLKYLNPEEIRETLKI